MALDTPTNLKAGIGADTVELHTRDDDAALGFIRSAGYDVSPGPDALTVFTADGEGQVGRLVELVGGGVDYVHVHRPTLDDVFLHYTGRQIREEGAAMPSARARAWRHRR